MPDYDDSFGSDPCVLDCCSDLVDRFEVRALLVVATIYRSDRAASKVSSSLIHRVPIWHDEQCFWIISVINPIVEKNSPRVKRCDANLPSQSKCGEEFEV